MRDWPSENACSVLTHATVSVRLSEIAALRDLPGPATAPQLPKRFLRYSDEQTVVGMSAMLRAIDRLPEPRPAFDRWGVLAASCHAGRIMGAAAVIGTRAVGAQGVSPHLVPQSSLHSPASAASVALSMHGPHFGIGGGPEAFDEAMLTVCSMVVPSRSASRVASNRDHSVEPSGGAWLILTAWDSEPSLDAAGAPTSDPTCHGLAVAVMPCEVGDAEATLAVVPAVFHGVEVEALAAVPSMADRIRSLACALDGTAASKGGSPGCSTIPLRHGFTLRVPCKAAARSPALEAA